MSTGIAATTAEYLLTFNTGENKPRLDNNSDEDIVAPPVLDVRNASVSARSRDLLRAADEGGFIHLRKDLRAAQSGSLVPRKRQSIHYLLSEFLDVLFIENEAARSNH